MARVSSPAARGRCYDPPGGLWKRWVYRKWQGRATGQATREPRENPSVLGEIRRATAGMRVAEETVEGCRQRAAAEGAGRCEDPEAAFVRAESRLAMTL